MLIEGDQLVNSRTRNVAQNASWAIITQITTILLSFISRTVFIHVLGVEYLGVNGLFTNILTILSFAELGIGNAIIYSLYKPLAFNNQQKVKVLMDFYAKAYNIIGIVVFTIGMLIIPFLNFIIKEPPNIMENIIFIYFLFLLNTTISYFFVYKKSIIIADQKNYIVSLYQQVFLIFQVLLQLTFLVLTQNYIMFLVIQIACTLLNNVFTGRKADKLYPYIKIRTAEKLDSDEKSKIYKDVKALFLYKLASVILNGTDNIMISSMIGLAAVGLTSNYLLIISAFTNITNQIMNSFTASIGNLNATSDGSNREKVFNKMLLISNWMYGLISIGIVFLINDFIILWIGEDYIISNITVIALALNFYFVSVHKPAFIFRTTMGFFVEGRFAPVAAAILNIVLSIALGIRFGLAGIFIATSISRLLTIGIVDPLLIYRKGFHKSPKIYFAKSIKYALSMIVIYYLIEVIMHFVSYTGMIGFLIRMLTIIFIYNIIMLAMYGRTMEFKELSKSVINLIKR